MSLALVTHARPGWLDCIRELHPGAHVAIFADNSNVGIEGRLVGLELRDTLLVLRSGPQSSFVFLFRKPCAENTVAEQMAATATGAINVAACRVGFNSDADRKQALPGSMPKANQSIGTFQTRDRTTERPEDAQNSAGRWPANVVLVHGPECRQEGTKRVPCAKAFGSPADSKGGILNKTGVPRTNPHPGFADEDGLETVASWACEPDCPAKILDEQTGKLTSGAKENRVPLARLREGLAQRGNHILCRHRGRFPLLPSVRRRRCPVSLGHDLDH